jgi:hypothetical protein
MGVGGRLPRLTPVDFEVRVPQPRPFRSPPAGLLREPALASLDVSPSSPFLCPRGPDAVRGKMGYRRGLIPIGARDSQAHEGRSVLSEMHGGDDFGSEVLRVGEGDAVFVSHHYEDHGTGRCVGQCRRVSGVCEPALLASHGY